MQSVHAEKLKLGLRRQCGTLCRGEKDDEFRRVNMLLLCMRSRFQGLELSGHIGGHIVPL